MGGDGFALLEQIAGERRVVQAGIEGEPGQAAVLDDEGRALVLAPLPASGRSLSVPVGVGTELVLYDESGVEAGRAPLDASLHRLVVKPPPRAGLSFRYTDGAGSPVPVHVIFRGLGGTRDPSPVARAGAFAGGRSLLPGGRHRRRRPSPPDVTA